MADEVRVRVVCRRCGSAGRVRLHGEAERACPDCDGTGERVESLPLADPVDAAALVWLLENWRFAHDDDLDAYTQCAIDDVLAAVRAAKEGNDG